MSIILHITTLFLALSLLSNFVTIFSTFEGFHYQPPKTRSEKDVYLSAAPLFIAVAALMYLYYHGIPIFSMRTRDLMKTYRTQVMLPLGIAMIGLVMSSFLAWKGYLDLKYQQNVTTNRKMYNAANASIVTLTSLIFLINLVV
jgi:hypothetical protein